MTASLSQAYGAPFQLSSRSFGAAAYASRKTGGRLRCLGAVLTFRSEQARVPHNFVMFEAGVWLRVKIPRSRYTRDHENIFKEREPCCNLKGASDTVQRNRRSGDQRVCNAPSPQGGHTSRAAGSRDEEARTASTWQRAHGGSDTSAFGSWETR